MITKSNFNEIVKNLKQRKTVKSIIAVGSAKNLTFDKTLNDIDLFIIEEGYDEQFRKIEVYYGMDFDLNFFSVRCASDLIKTRELFFIHALSDATIVFDTKNIGLNIIGNAKRIFNEGPEALNDSDIQNEKIQILDKLGKIKSSEEIDKFEHTFLSNLCIKDIIHLYYRKMRYWVPKDKKIIKDLKTKNLGLYNILKDYYASYEIEKLEKALDYVINFNAC